jgi:hypothetical protein
MGGGPGSKRETTDELEDLISFKGGSYAVA